MNTLVLATDTPDQHVQDTMNCTKGVIFLGTRVQHHGRWPDINEGFKRLLGHTGAQWLYLILSTQHVNGMLDRFPIAYRDRFAARQNMLLLTLFEEYIGDPSRKVVAKESAIIPGVDDNEIPADHMDMAKVNSTEYDGYFQILSVLQRWVEALQMVTKSTTTSNSSDCMLKNPDDSVTGSMLANASKDANMSGHPTASELLQMANFNPNTSKCSHSEASGGSSEEPTNQVLSPDVVHWLESNGFADFFHQGRRTISTTPLLASFSFSTEVLPSDGLNWSLSDSDRAFSHKIDIPVRLLSAETYEYLGYKREVAERLWHNYECLDNPCFDILEAAKECLRNAAVSRDHLLHNWSVFMDEIGISSELRETILDEEFSEIRLTASCEFWLQTAMEIRWQELQSLDKNLLGVIERTGAVGEGPIGSGSSTLSQDYQSLQGHNQPAKGQDGAKVPNQMEPGKDEKGDLIPQIGSGSTVSSSKSKDSFELWRGGTKNIIESCKVNKTLYLKNIRSVPGDFSGIMSVPYFTPDKSTALRYGAYSVALSGLGLPPYLLSFTVSQKWLNDLHHQCLWSKEQRCGIESSKPCSDPNPESWADVVFRCRTKDYDPDCLSEKDLAIGHIAKFHHEEFKAMESHKEVLEGVLMIGDNPAVQYVFISQKSQKALERDAVDVTTTMYEGPAFIRYRRNCKGKPSIDDVIPFSEKNFSFCQNCSAMVDKKKQ
ncbi:hypothetical protein ACHAP8_009876 [Fusarium lateritium]